VQRIYVKYGVLNSLNVFVEFEYVTDHRGIFTSLNRLGSESSGKGGHSVSAALEDTGL